jgi:hypothetical protein
MLEFLVRFRDGEKYVRVEAREVRHIERLFPHDCTSVIAHQGLTVAFRIELHHSSVRLRKVLPLGVYLGWIGARYKKIRWGFQLVCWFALGFLLTLLAGRSLVPALWLVLVGLANVFAWWLLECERGRIDPVVRRAREYQRGRHCTSQGKRQP